MKIAVDIRSASGEKAGKGWFTFYIIKNLLEQDQENHYLLYAQNKTPGFDKYKNAQIKVINSKGILWHYKTAKDIQKEEADIFIAPTSYIIPVLLPKSIKTILVVHDLVAFFYPRAHNKKAAFIERFLLKTALKKAQKVIAVSKNTKNDIIQKFNYEKNKINVVYCSASDDFKPIETGTLKSFVKKTNLPANFFLSVGTLEPRKNYVNLVKAFAAVNKRYPNYHLIIVGNNGWNYEQIYEEIKINYLQKKVHILGYLSGKSLNNLYNLAKGFVFPSLYEGFGIPPLEAMKCGCPVITSNTSSLPEVVGDSAILVNPQSVPEIAKAIVSLIEDKNLCNELRKKGLKQAKKFSWVKSACKLLKVIEQL
ncbi:MAG: glycosyltransferase family 1 protein [Patescibacteria group bacterium]